MAVLSDADLRRRAWDAAARVVDPEIPVLTIADLGVLREVNVSDGHVEVAITPTYSGCPAMNMIALEIELALEREGFAKPNPRPMFPNPPGLLRIEPYSEGLRERIWWGAGSNTTAVWAAKLGMNLQSSTLKNDETGEAFHVQQAAQIRAYRAAWKEAGHAREPRVSVSRSIFALINKQDRAYFGNERQGEDQIGFIDANTRAIFGRSYAAEPDVLIEQLKQDEAIAEADTLLLTVPNQLGVAYNAHVIEAILTHVAPALGWR